MNIKHLFLLPALVLAAFILPAEARSQYVVVVKTQVETSGDCTPSVNYYEAQKTTVHVRLQRAGFTSRNSGSAEDYVQKFGAAVEVFVVLGEGWVAVDRTHYAGPPELSWIEQSAAQAVVGGICACETYGRGYGRISFPWRFALPGYRHHGSTRLPLPPAPPNLFEAMERVSPRVQYLENEREKKRKKEEKKRREEERRKQ